MTRLKMFRYGLVFLLLGMTAVFTQAQDDAVQILDEYTIEPDSLVVTVTATGVVDPARSVNLAFQYSAPVSEVFVQEGDTVRTGDLIALLDAEELEAAVREAELALELQQLAYQALIDPPREVDIAAAEAAVNAAEAAIPAARSGPSAQQIQIAGIQAELARNQLWQAQLNRDNLFENNPEFRGGLPNEIAVQSQVAQAEIGVNIADASYNATLSRGGGIGAVASAEAQLIRAQIALEDLLDGPDEVELLKFEIQLDQTELAVEQARVALERARLEAPFDGVVAQNNLSLGELPPQGFLPAIQLVDNSSYYVDLAIDESDVVNVELGQSVSLRLDALPESEVTGQITRISMVPDENSTIVVYRARVTLDPTDAPIRVGMSTTATITTRELQDVIVLPNRFIRIDQDTQQAFVTIQSGENQFQEIPIQLGERNSTVSQIVSGLEIGQRVVQVPRESLGLDDVFEGGPPNS